MPFRKEIHDIVPLVGEPLSVIELAKAGCLPPALHIDDIAQLLYPDEVKLQKALKVLLKTAIRKKALNVLTIEKNSQIKMEHQRSRNPGKYRDPRPPGQLAPLSAFGVGYGEEDLLPEDQGFDRRKRRIFVVHRDEMKKWLQTENKWPLDKGILLSNWWPVESGGTEKESGVYFSDRVSVKELIDALDGDPIYSINKRSFMYLIEILPEKDMPPFNPLGHGTYSLLFVLAWTSYCKPPLKIYLPGKKESPSLSWEIARTFTDYRFAHGYRIEGSTRFIKFGDFEIDINQLRQFLLSHELCLPVKLYPRDPANCQRQYEIEQEDHQRNFREEVQFSQLLPRIQEDVIEAVKNRQQLSEIEFCKRAVRALDDLNVLLTNNQIADKQRKEYLSDECLEAIDYIELRCRPLLAPEPATSENIFRKEGEMWHVQYAEKKDYFDDIKGFLYVFLLLRGAGKEFHVQQLQGEANRLDVRDSFGYGGVISEDERDKMNADGAVGVIGGDGKASVCNPVIDDQALKAYKDRIAELDRLIDYAEDYRNFSMKRKLEEDRVALRREIIRASGLGGELRAMSDDAEKARKAVSEAIRRALKKIEKENERLYFHLKNAISLGVYCKYAPEIEQNWIIF
jgi:hypothetical protein